MGLTRQEVKALAKRFYKEYGLANTGYVNGCGVSRVGSLDPECSDAERNDYCIQVLLSEKLPKNIKLPPNYRGVRVFYKITGKLRALKKRV